MSFLNPLTPAEMQVPMSGAAMSMPFVGMECGIASCHWRAAIILASQTHRIAVSSAPTLTVPQQKRKGRHRWDGDTAGYC